MPACHLFPEHDDSHALDPSYESTQPNHNPANAQTFKKLQKTVGVGLVVPVGEDHIFDAAMNSKFCKLTPSVHTFGVLPKEEIFDERLTAEAAPVHERLAVPFIVPAKRPGPGSSKLGA